MRTIKSSTFKLLISLLVITMSISLFNMTVYAETPTDNSLVSSELKTENVEINEYKDEILSLLEQNEKNQATIETYRSLYSTWTGIIFVLFTLFGIVLPIVIAVGLDKWKKIELDKEINKVRKQSDEQYQKLLHIQNALSLVTFGNYWEANKCFERILRNYPNDSYVKMYSTICRFRELDIALDADPDPDAVADKEEEVYDIINSFIDLYYDTNGDLANELMMGSIFGSSTILEVSSLISRLANCEKTFLRSDFIKICKKASEYILDNLNIKKEDELFDFDQTDVFIMQYKSINYYLCLAYSKNNSRALKKQLEKTIRLFDADDFSREDDCLGKCKQMLNELK